MKRPVYVLCNGSSSFLGHATTVVGARRIASKYGYSTKGQPVVSAPGGFILTDKA